MKVETPGFKRCCLCVPLRYGILFWGYLRLIIELLFFILTIVIMVHLSALKAQIMSDPLTTDEDKLLSEKRFIEDFIIVAVIISLLFLDICFSLTLIIGGHQKKPRLLFVYEVYNIVTTVLMLIVLISSAVFKIYVDNYLPFIARVNPAQFYHIIKYEFGMGLLFLAIQLYFIFLLRSEIKKLKGNCQFRFVNNATESHCVLEVEAERGVDGVSGTAGEGDGTGGPGDGPQGDAREGEGGTARRHGEYTRF